MFFVGTNYALSLSLSLSIAYVLPILKCFAYLSVLTETGSLRVLPQPPSCFIHIFLTFRIASSVWNAAVCCCIPMNPLVNTHSNASQWSLNIREHPALPPPTEACTLKWFRVQALACVRGDGYMETRLIA